MFHYFMASPNKKINFSKILVGNKSDKKESEQVTEKEGKQVASQLGISHLRSSAETGINIDKIFNDLTKEILSKRRHIPGNDGNSIDLNKQPARKGCCT